MLNEYQEKLVLDNQKLITYVIKRFELINQYDEFYDIGMIGLVKGSISYNPDLGFKVSSYLVKCIQREILMELKKRKTYSRKANYNTVSFDKEVKVGKNGGIKTFKDFIASNIDIEQQLIQNEILKEITNIIKNLDSREQFIIEHSFGINGFKKLKQYQIAEILNIKPKEVSRLKNNIIKKISSSLKG